MWNFRRLARVVAPLILLGMVAAPARARQEQDGRGLRLALLPIVFSSPDTRLALGVLPQLIFLTAPGTRPSNLRADVYYTFNNQFNVLLQPAVWLPGDRWQFAGKFRFRKWPTSFYGIGRDSPRENPEEFTEFVLSGSAEALMQIRPGIYVGAGYAMRWGRIRDPEPADGDLAGGAVPGAGDSRVAGMGLVATYDTREHLYLPRSGSLYRLQVDRYAPAFGGDRSYTRLTVDLRQYVTIAGPVTAAFQAVLSVTDGEVPFRVMPNVGEIVRGYTTTRYIDRQRWAVQAEFRAIPVWWRLGLVVFGGVGDVADRIGDFRDGRLSYAVGIGARFLMYSRERITIRQDFAFGRDSSGDYLDLNEAF